MLSRETDLSWLYPEKATNVPTEKLNQQAQSGAWCQETVANRKQTNTINKGAFIPGIVSPKQKEMKSTPWELDQLMLRWQNSSIMCTLWFDVIILIQN